MQSILVAVDLSPTMGAVLGAAEDLSRGREARLFVIHVANPVVATVATEVGPIVSRNDLADELREDRRKVRAVEKRLKLEGFETNAFVREGNPIEQILHEADRLSADLIVVGSHGHGALYDLLLGSTSSGILRKAKCPVLVVPARTREVQAGRPPAVYAR